MHGPHEQLDEDYRRRPQIRRRKRVLRARGRNEKHGEEVTGERIEVIHIVDGGSRNALLNQFTADASGCPVFAGPVEATVFGNVLVQARARGKIGSLDEMRGVVRASGGVTQFDPKNDAAWTEPRARFARLNRDSLMKRR